MPLIHHKATNLPQRLVRLLEFLKDTKRTTEEIRVHGGPTGKPYKNAHTAKNVCYDAAKLGFNLHHDLTSDQWWINSDDLPKDLNTLGVRQPRLFKPTAQIRKLRKLLMVRPRSAEEIAEVLGYYQVSSARDLCYRARRPPYNLPLVRDANTKLWTIDQEKGTNHD